MVPAAPKAACTHVGAKVVMANYSCANHCRFREEELFDDMAQWERKGEGIKPLPADTEVVANINDHRYVPGSPKVVGLMQISKSPHTLVCDDR